MNKPIQTIVVAIIVAAAAFYGGIQYQKNQTPVAGNGQFARRFGGQGVNGNVRPVAGEIISSDSASLTVKLQDGTTKIVILSDKTQISKAAPGSKTDLTTGTRIAAFGTANSDGSITAQNVSINPMMRLNNSR